ncbi:HAD family hydrolase [Pseudonocardia sp. HH130630-07]|uniref:HAD family hydrolase n=1 Tax=Pseudonocardia sp. HH130630-07 TaxID=1690815 RepID=UPI0008150191|nr:HAD family phosphatase [Pseudonocardia sp. HH130630-07]ANY09075.1 hypothetical protein AFB00_25615 [Pseudonocardia sp. HH130630-07]
MSAAGPAVASGDTVLLDMDGTLVLSEHVHRRSWARFFDSWDLAVDDATYERTYMGRRALDVFAEVDGPWRETDPAELNARLVAYSDELAAEVEIVAGAREMIAELHARGHRIAIVTSAGRSWAGRIVDALGVGAMVELTVTAEDVRTGKPDPECYLTACRRLGVDASRCVGFEDSPSGVRALAAAGVGTIVGVTNTAAAATLTAAGAGRTVPDLTPRTLLD